MCAQCWASATSAAVAVTGATGLRAWAAAKRPRWLSDGRLKVLTAGLIVVAILAASVRV